MSSAVLIAAAAFSACREEPASHRSSTANSSSGETTTGNANTGASTSAGATAEPRAATARVGDAGSVAGRLTKLTLLPQPPRGSFRGVTSDGRTFAIGIATTNNAYPHRRPLAYFRMAQALGMTSVPLTAERRLSVAELSELLPAGSEALRFVKRHARITNDGAATALFVAHRAGNVHRVSDSADVLRWAKLAANAAPLSGKDHLAVRGYVEMVVLDFLSGNAGRQQLVVDDQTGQVSLVDNRSAFRGVVTPDDLDAVRRPLRPIARFPRGLRAALARFDSGAARQTLCPGRFEHWLVAPRVLVGVAERRATLLTLLDSRVMQLGEDVALSL